MKKVIFGTLLLITSFSFNSYGQVISQGEFGKEFHLFKENYNKKNPNTPITNDVILLLNNSTTFHGMMSALDKKYLSNREKVSFGQTITLDQSSLDSPLSNKFPLGIPPEKDSVFLKERDNFFNNDSFTGGKYKGRRIILIQNGLKEFFTTPGTSEQTVAGYGCDVIHIKVLSQNSDQRNGEMIQSMAHEFTHAYNYVTGKSKPANNILKTIIDAGINDEIAARNNEYKIIRECTKNNSLPGFTIDTPKVEKRIVQRDLTPFTLTSTYLEGFLINALMQNELRNISGNISLGDSVSAIDTLDLFTELKFDPLTKTIGIANKDGRLKKINFKYNEYRAIQRFVDNDWQEWKARNGTEIEKENILQKHNNDFFNGLAVYEP